LIFWGDYFDELATTLLTATLREAGLSVRVVGVGGRYASGRYGVTIRADLGISDTVKLGDRVACVVLPCQYSEYSQIANDPRLQNFLRQLFAAGKLFVIHQELQELCRSWSQAQSALPSSPTPWVYPEGDALPLFAGTVADRLSGRSKDAQHAHVRLHHQLFPSHLPQFAAP
jgi:hypothetical protein